MQIAAAVAEAAHRIGLSLSVDGDPSLPIKMHRSGWTVEIDAADLFDASKSRTHHLRAAWALLGVRLGIDKLSASDDDEPAPSSPQQFRRTPVRRYHEAPSVHGDRLQFLVPTITRQTFEAVAGTTALSRNWLFIQLEILLLRETGKRLDILTDDESQPNDSSDDRRWQKARSALFYQSYKIRPISTVDVPGGRLRIIETGEGFGASRALLLPEFDYDASRDYGYLAIPTRDRLIIARPREREVAPQMLPGLRDALTDSMGSSNFALTDAIVQLEPDNLRLLQEPTLRLDIDPPPSERILSVTPP